MLFGTLPKICFAGGMTSYLYERKIRIFDYPKFAEPSATGGGKMPSGWPPITGWHGLIRKIGHTYKYYLTRFGKAVITTGLKLRELVIIPQLAIGTAA